MDEISAENDETIVLKDVDRLEEIILEGIPSIRKSFHRPSYTAILSLVNSSD